MQLAITLFLLIVIYPVSAQFERRITFKSSENSLAGTLTFPVKKGKHPGVIITLGSGSQNRDCEVDGLKPFKVVAAELARNGFIVLRYDNRSKGLSTGKSIDQATTQELATDAQAAFRYLRSQKDVDKRRIGFIGHSEGSTIATIAVSVNPEVKFLLAINGTTSAGFEDILLNTEQRLKRAGKSRDTIQYYLKNLKIYLGRPDSTSPEKRKIAARNITLFEISQLPVKERVKITKEEIESSINSQMREVSSRWEKQYLALNPGFYYKQINCPVSLLFSDSEVDGLLTKRLTLFKKLLNEDNRPYTIRIIKNTDHNLIRTKLGTDQQSKAVSLDFVKAVAEEAKKRI